ncbi:MAG: hypothetical protein Q9188_004965 [Gyalolechia gomerana]
MDTERSSTDIDARIDAEVEQYFEERRRFRPLHFNATKKELEKFQINYNISKQKPPSPESDFFEYSPTFDLDLPPFLDSDDPTIDRVDRIESVKRLVHIILLVRNHWVCLSEFQGLLIRQLAEAPTKFEAFKAQEHEKFCHGWLETMERLKTKTYGWANEFQALNWDLVRTWFR